jgi:hypothetical protein
LTRLDDFGIVGLSHWYPPGLIWQVLPVRIPDSSIYTHLSIPPKRAAFARSSNRGRDTLLLSVGVELS